MRRKLVTLAVSLGAVLSMAEAASAGTQFYTLRTQLRTCTVYADLEKREIDTVLFQRLSFGGGLLTCTRPTNAEVPQSLLNANGSVQLFNLTSGNTVGAPVSYNCDNTRGPCENGRIESVLRNGNRYVAQVAVSLWLGNTTYCARYATDAKGHRYCADYQTEAWQSASGCFISGPLIRCPARPSTPEAAS